MSLGPKFQKKVFCTNGQECRQIGTPPPPPPQICSHLCDEHRETVGTGRKHQMLGPDPDPLNSGRAGGVLGWHCLHEHLCRVLPLLAPLLEGEDLATHQRARAAAGRIAATSQLTLKQPKFAPGPLLFPGNRKDEDAQTQPSPQHHPRTAKQREATNQTQ